MGASDLNCKMETEPPPVLEQEEAGKEGVSACYHVNSRGENAN